MSLSKSKIWYSSNCLHFSKHVVPLFGGQQAAYSRVEHLKDASIQLYKFCIPFKLCSPYYIRIQKSLIIDAHGLKVLHLN
jgi:hypothetical protein